MDVLNDFTAKLEAFERSLEWSSLVVNHVRSLTVWGEIVLAPKVKRGSGVEILARNFRVEV